MRTIVPADHLAWKLRTLLEKFDSTEARARYSSLGRRGLSPDWLLGVWVLGALMGVHHSTVLASRLKTDAGLRVMTRGHTVAQSALRKFRLNNRALFEEALLWTIKLAVRHDWIDASDLSVDSMRLQANAAKSAVRSVDRSTRRSAQLAKVQTELLTPEARAIHEAKVRKHDEALALCAARGSASVVLTNEAAALMKFPNGASAPGHRITLTSAGQGRRFALGVIVDASGTDDGKLKPAVLEVLRVLEAAGLPQDRLIQIAADAGYDSCEDLSFATSVRDRVDILVALKSAKADAEPAEEQYFSRRRFTIHEDGTASCPAGKKMKGPQFNRSTDRTLWFGIGCEQCPLREQCTDGKRRSLTANLELEKHRREMETRMAKPDAAARYKRRMATVEPVFAYLESTMGFRRAACRTSESVKAEVVLNLVAYNLQRLIFSPKISVVFVVPWRS